MTPSATLQSIGLFVAAGLCEIGGGYLVWLWLREERSASTAPAMRCKSGSSPRTASVRRTCVFD